MSGLFERAMRRPPPKRAFDALVRTRRRLRGLRSRLGPTDADIIDRVLVLAEVRALAIAAELDLAGLVHESPRSTAELAAATGSDLDSLDRMLELLAVGGVFAKNKNGRWRNTRTSSVLRSDHPSSMRNWARFFGSRDVFRIWGDLDTTIRTGDSATAVTTGAEFFDWLRADPTAADRFNGSMQETSRLLGTLVAAAVDFDGAHTICDIGGGTGRLLALILAAHPHLRGVLFDLPEVVAGGTVLDAAGVASRVDVVGGSFFEPGGVPPGCDRHILVSIVHDWDDDRSAQILANCRESLAENGRILVVETVLEPERPPLFARHSDVLMLVLTGAGRERTREHFDSLFTRAGLAIARTWALATGHVVFELAPAAAPAAGS